MIPKLLSTLPLNSAGERQIETHQIDDNLTALESALLSAIDSIVQTGGVALPGTVTLTGTTLRVQGRQGITLDGNTPVQVTDMSLSLAALAAGKARAVILPTPQTVNRAYTDVVTSQSITDAMNTTLGAVAVIGAADAGVTLDAGGYPVCPLGAMPVCTLTKTAGGVTLDLVENPAIVLRGAAAGGGSGLPAGGTTGQVLIKTGPSDGAAGWANVAGGLAQSGTRLSADGQQVYTGVTPPQIEVRYGGITYVTAMMALTNESVTQIAPAPLYSEFASRAAGPLGGQGAWRTRHGTATVNADKSVSVSDDVQTSGMGTVLDRVVGEGLLTAQIAGGSLWMLGWHYREADAAHYAVWNAGTQFGNKIEIGWLTGTGATAVTSKVATLVAPTTDYNVEVEIGPGTVGSTLGVRVWAIGSARPAALSTSYTLVAGDLLLPEGTVSLHSLVNGTPVLKTLTLNDGNQHPNAQEAQASYIGRWVPRVEAGQVVMATLNQGAELRAQVSGTAQVTGQFVVSPVSTQTPTVAVSVDGGAYTRLVLPAGPGPVSLQLASGLSTNQAHTLSVIADGIHELDPVWQRGAGLLVAGLSVDAGGVAAPWTDQKKSVLWVGTSIFNGILARSAAGGTLPANSAGSLAYPAMAMRQAGGRAVVCGFGGQGVTQGGSGGVPAAITTVSSFMQGRSQPTVTVAGIVIGQGVNDSAASSGDFQTAYTALIAQLRSTYGSVPLFLERPLNGTHAADVQAVAAATSNCTYVDTSTWAVTTTDGVHPDLGGHANAAARWAQALASLALTASGSAAPPAAGTNYADDFNRADGPLGSNWTTTAPFTISGGVVSSSAAGPARFGPLVTQGTVGLDISANAALVFGANANFSDYYALYRTDGASGGDNFRLHIYHQVNGVGTDMIGGVAATSAAGRQKFSLTVNGTAITIRDSAGGVLYGGGIPGLQPGYMGMFTQPGNSVDNFTLNVVS